MKTTYQYIEFRRIPFKGRTQKWACYNRSSGILLGLVAWYPAWRQYCFFPHSGLQGTVFSTGCLEDIQDFIAQCEQERGKQKEVEEAEDEAVKQENQVRDHLNRAGLTFRKPR